MRDRFFCRRPELCSPRLEGCSKAMEFARGLLADLSAGSIGILGPRETGCKGPDVEDLSTNVVTIGRRILFSPW